MKILINLLAFNKSFTGAGYYIIRLLKIIKDIDNSNQYILLVNENSKILEFIKETENIKYYYLKIPSTSRTLRVLFEQFILPFKLIGIDYDIFFSPNPVLPILSLEKRKKYLCTIHDLSPLIVKKDNYIQKLYYKYMTLLSSKKAEKIIVVSGNTKKDIIKFLKVREEKIRVIYNFIENDFNVCSNQKDNNLSEKYFLYVGNIHLGKNLLNLVKAFALFKNKTNSSLKLYLAGKDGYGSDKIYNEVKKRDLRNEVIFLGYVSDENIKTYYKNAFALVFPSFYEGFGYPPLEAMSFGVLPIVSNTSSIPEIVGDAGIYFDPYSVESIANALEASLFIDKENYKNIMKKQVKKFDGYTQGKKFIDILDEIKYDK